MSLQGTADAVKEGVQAVANKLQDSSIQEPQQDGTQPNLLLDEATGEHVSKTELKKRQKQREKDAKKAEKEATRQAPPAPKRKAQTAEEDESKLSANVRRHTLSSIVVFCSCLTLDPLLHSNTLKSAAERSSA